MRYVTLKVDICHLPLEAVSHKLLPLLTLNTSWKEFRVEIRSEAFCVLGKTGRTGLQTVRYFQGKILWVQFLHLLLSRKARKSFMWCLLLVTSNNLHETSNYLLKERVLDCVYSPFTTISYLLTFLPYLFGAVSQSYLKCCLPGYSSHFAPNKTWLTTLTLCIFFSRQLQKK